MRRVNFPSSQYIGKMQLKYNEEADRNGVYIISACGAVDSIPVDVGAVYLQSKFPGKGKNKKVRCSRSDNGRIG